MVRLNINESIEFPEKVNISIEGVLIKISGPYGILERRITNPMIKISLEKNVINLNLSNGTKREKMMLKTIKAILKNMIKGVSEKYVYKLKICSSHFPITVSKEGRKIIVKNFLGERVPRYANVVGGVEVNINGDTIVVEGIDKEKVGQTAANIERATRMTNKDRRRFQDGIFIFEKAGVKI